MRSISGAGTPKPVVVCLTATGLTHVRIPPDATTIYLFSVAGKAAGDVRRLGAVISDISLDGEVLAMTHAALSRGFHRVEMHGARAIRWTNGHGVITVAPQPAERTLDVMVHVIAPGAANAPPTWHGELEIVTRDRVAGWAWDGANPDLPVALSVLSNGVEVARVLANRYDQRLDQAGVGDGRHRFEIDIPGGLSPLQRHLIEIRREDDGQALPDPPQIIEPATQFDQAMQTAFANALAALGTGEEHRKALQFLVTQTEQALARQADFDGQKAERQAYRKFHRRWGPAAAAMPGPRDPGLRALIIDERIPVAGRDAGSQAILSHIQALQRLGYAVSFAAAEEMGSLAPNLEAAGISVCTTPFYACVEDVLRRQDSCFDLIYLHRADIAARYLTLARRYSQRGRLIYSVADLHHVRLQRQSVVEDRPELMALSHKTRLAECTAAWLADAVITHSTEEADLLRLAVPKANVHQVPWDVPLRATTMPFEARRGVAFIGGYGHPPNIDAAYFLVETIMPLVWQYDPAIECHLVGSAMPEAITRLAGPRIIIMGQVDDLGAKVFDKVRLTVAPLRYGAGVKGKVLESFAAGIPCVMSPIAAEGIGLPLGLQAMIGHGPEELAAHICRYHADQALSNAAAAAGIEMINQRFSGDIVTQRLLAAIEGRQATPISGSQPALL